ncbi:hypothetical protein GPECTOR_4g955 [Gonium pectorale]|uniref:Uncharacterized protein n=1 Tax=Gonium pectorale TaxID=33097 RepID=A0A150GYQ2_GONPE|nr:hypothetical protein GPECTOR_4g955 [Gonium pectorale]|eukprot:KXZ54883.1 hypothetical protein GPECTOR_4g955 [Gonium pectorale]
MQAATKAVQPAAGAAAAAAAAGSHHLPLGQTPTPLSRLAGAAQRAALEAKSLYRGVLGAAGGAGIIIGAFFAFYSTSKQLLRERTDLPEGTVAFIAGAVAAVGSSVVKVPIAVCIRSVQAGVYPNVFVAARSVVARAGPRGLFTGFLPTLLEDVPDMAVKFAVYETLRAVHMRLHHMERPSTLEDLLMGGVAGSAAAAATTPLDVVKTRMMCAASERPTVLQAVRGVIADSSSGGPAAFFRGVGPRALSNGLNSAIFYCWFELLRERLRAALASEAAARQQHPPAVVAAAPSVASATGTAASAPTGPAQQAALSRQKHSQQQSGQSGGGAPPLASCTLHMLATEERRVETEEATHGALANNSDFPSLNESAKMPQQPKAKAKKGAKLNLGEFLAMPTGSRGDFGDKSLQDKAILLSLPTAPRGGPREEGDGRPAGGLGGGFRDYGGDRGGGSRFNREDRPPREEREPSRADTVDDWGSTRKFVPGGDGGGGFGGGSRGFGGGGGGGFADRGDRGDRPPREPRAPSAADQIDDWGSTRKWEPSGAPAPRGGFGDDRRGGERRFDGPPPPSKADLEDSWGRGRDYRPSEAPAGGRGGFSGGPRDAPRETSADREERWARRAAEAPASSSGPAEAGASERPRLKLAPRSVPAGEGPVAASANGGEDRKAGANPFGAARPREEVLKEKGVDPIKEALKLEHGEVIRDETPAEKALKAEVEEMTKQLAELKTKAEAEAEGEAANGDAEGGLAKEVEELAAQLDAKERALFKLMAEEDDRVRFARGGGGREREREPREPREGREPREREPRGPPRREEGASGGGAAPPPRRDRW